MATETPVVPVSPAPVTSKPVTPPIPAAQIVTPKPAEKPAEARARIPAAVDLMANLKNVAAQAGLVGEDGVAQAKPQAPTLVEAKKSEVSVDKKAAPVAEKKVAEPSPASEEDPFSNIKEPDGMSEKSKEGWKALKKESATKLKEAQTKYTEAVAQLDTFRKATPAQQEDVANLKVELQAAHDRLAVFDVAATPEFTKQFVEPKNKAIAEAKMLLTDNAKDVPNMDALLSLPRSDFAKKVSEMAAEMPAFDQSSFVNAMRQAYQIQGDSANALTNARELRVSLDQKRAANERQAFEETFSTFDQKVAAWVPSENADADERASVEAFNNERAALKANAERYAFGKMDAKGVAELAAKAASADLINKHAIPRMNREFAKLQALNQEVIAELNAIKAAKRPGSFTATETPAADTGKPKSFSEIMREAKVKSGQ